MSAPLLVNHQMTAHIEMDVDGWTSFQPIEPDLNALTPEVGNIALEDS